MKNDQDPVKASKNAQSIIELAVFGAVLFFLIGGMALNAVSGSLQQNSRLQAMRIAMLKSYQSSQAGTHSRVSASYLYYEDRLNGDFGRYGSQDRQPVTASGAGMLSKNVFMPVDWNEPQDLPMMDVKVNGQEFEFTTSAFVHYKILLREGAAVPARLEDANPDDVVIMMYKPEGGACPAPILNSSSTDPNINWKIGWRQSCPGDPCVINLNSAENKVQRQRLVYEWTNHPEGGYPPFYQAIVSNDTDYSLTADTQRRFDYTRNGFYDDDLPNYDYAMWQWRWDSIDTVVGKIDKDNGNFPTYDTNGDLSEETVYDLEKLESPYIFSISEFAAPLTPAALIDAIEASGITVPAGATEIDRLNSLLVDPNVYQAMSVQPATTTAFIDRLKAGEVLSVLELQQLNRLLIEANFPAQTPPRKTTVCGAYKGYIVSVMDTAVADYDTTKGAEDFVDPNRRPGMRADMRIYTRTNDGGYTYFDVREGKEYSSDGTPLNISTVKKSQYDVVERILQLNVNMIDPDALLARNKSIETSCSGGAATTPTGYSYIGIGGGCCMGSAQTCFDKDAKTLFIRSRISDKRGRKWVTATDEDWQQSLGQNEHGVF